MAPAHKGTKGRIHPNLTEGILTKAPALGASAPCWNQGRDMGLPEGSGVGGSAFTGPQCTLVTGGGASSAPAPRLNPSAECPV